MSDSKYIDLEELLKDSKDLGLELHGTSWQCQREAEDYAKHFLQPPEYIAELFGLDLVVPSDPNQLFIDIDRAEDEVHFKETCAFIKNVFGITVVVEKETVSKDGGDHKHIYARLDLSQSIVCDRLRQLTPLERCLFQVCLGSDRVHELLGLFNIWRGEKPTVFFEVPAEKK